MEHSTPFSDIAIADEMHFAEEVSKGRRPDLSVLQSEVP